MKEIAEEFLQESYGNAQEITGGEGWLCPECGNHIQRGWGDAEAHAHEYKSVVCRGCGLAFIVHNGEPYLMSDEVWAKLQEGLTPKDLFIADNFGITIHHVPRTKDGIFGGA